MYPIALVCLIKSDCYLGLFKNRNRLAKTKNIRFWIRFLSCFLTRGPKLNRRVIKFVQSWKICDSLENKSLGEVSCNCLDAMENGFCQTHQPTKSWKFWIILLVEFQISDATIRALTCNVYPITVSYKFYSWKLKSLVLDLVISFDRLVLGHPVLYNWQSPHLK